MFPLHDNIQPQSFPYVTYGIIAACSAAFLVQMWAGPSGDVLVERWGMVPARLLTESSKEAKLVVNRAAIVSTPFGQQVVEVARPIYPAAVSDWLTLFTCMFLHGGLMHIAGNMWFLHIFGDNVEDRFGHVGYAVMYLAAGVAAAATHLFSDPGSLIPTIGASGAIAGVMGAYIVLYPKAVVEAIIPLPIIFGSFSVPAPIFLGIWFAIQVFQGASSSSSSGGVAWWAHVGGFVAGVIWAGVVLLLQFNPTQQHERPVARRLWS
jgi:membrane associated rhomboid family serine protease